MRFLLPLAALASLAAPAPLAAQTTAPAPPRIINVFDDFAQYHRQAKDKQDQRQTLWDKLLEARHADFFRDAIYRKLKGADLEKHKAWCIRTFWSDVAPRMDALEKVNAGIGGQIQEVLASFRKHFPDFRGETDFYVTVSFTFRGKVVDVAGKNIFALGLEHFDQAGPLLPITIAHELFHLHHSQALVFQGGLYRTLWSEGLAVYASAVVVPGHKTSTYLGFDGRKMNRCHELLRQMAGELEKNMGQNDQRLKRVYFGAEPNDVGIPPEAGYYVGLLVAQSLARDHSLADLATMSAEKVFPLVQRELRRLLAAPAGK